jgi:ParB family chromosome partitioning protein
MSKRKAALAELSIAPVAVMTEERPIGARPGRLPIDRLYPNPDQPRHQFDPQTILELAADIAANGLLQPIRVRPPDLDGRHMIILGERRWRAVQKIDGLTVADVVVDYDIPDDDAAYDQALAENLQRDDLTRTEVAAALLNRKERYGLTNEALAVRYHKSVAWVDQHIRYAQLPEETRELMDRKGVDLKIAGVLQSIGPEAQIEVVEAIAELPDQRSQLDFARTVRDLRGAGADVGTALATARSHREAESSTGAAANGQGRQAGTRVGRPRAVAAPFELRTDHRGVTWLMVNAQGLATSRLIGKRELSPASWLQAIAADLGTFRGMCGANGYPNDWALVDTVIGPVVAPEASSPLKG